MLVVEDNQTDAATLGDLLKKAGLEHDLSFASTGNEALAFLESKWCRPGEHRWWLIHLMGKFHR